MSGFTSRLELNYCSPESELRALSDAQNRIQRTVTKDSYRWIVKLNRSMTDYQVSDYRDSIVQAIISATNEQRFRRSERQCVRLFKISYGIFHQGSELSELIGTSSPIRIVKQYISLRMEILFALTELIIYQAHMIYVVYIYNFVYHREKNI